MANPEHVNLVLKGREAILAWRRDHPGEKLDLRRAELWQKQLNGCDLSYALMEWTDLRWADLIECNFSGAQCERADFHKADMARVVLDGGNFARANFEDAKLVDAGFKSAVFGGTRFVNTEIVAPRDLATALHLSPSIIDDETLRASPDLPVDFLRGCGLFLPFQAIVYRVILGGPSDVEKDVAVAREAVHEWNDLYAQQRGQVLLPIWWKTHSTPQLGDRPQAILNRQLIDRGDVLVAVFWTRLGTPTGVAESGTAEEIERFLDADKPVLAYFCKRALPQKHDKEQWRRLEVFRDEVRKRGLVGEYSGSAELSRQLVRHLSATIDRLRSG